MVMSAQLFAVAHPHGNYKLSYELSYRRVS
jgi:hypothetical protein